MFHIYKFKKSDVEYQVLTEENINFLPQHMNDNNLTKMIITSDENNIGWNADILPNLDKFNFLEELLIYWTNIKDISEIHKCKKLKTIWLDNDDTTKINFNNFNYLQKVITWNRKGIESIWGVEGLKTLTLAKIKQKNIINGVALNSLDKLRIINSSIDNISFLKKTKNLTFLELLSLPRLETLEDLTHLNKLKHLRIDVSKVEEFSFLSELTNLETLYLKSKNGKLKVSNLSKMNKLKKFNFSGNTEMLNCTRELKNNKTGNGAN